MNKFILSSMPKMPSILFTVPTLIVMTWNVNFVYFLFLKADKIFDIFSKFQLLHCKNFTVKYISIWVAFVLFQTQKTELQSSRTKIWMFKQNESQSSSNLVGTIAGKISELRKKNREELNYNQSMEVAPLRSLDDFVLAKARFQVRICPALIVDMHN